MKIKFIIFYSFVSLIISRADAQESISLKGQWRFALDLNDEGMHKKWFIGNLADEIALPGTTDVAGWGTPDQSPWINYLQRKHKYIGVAWYQKTIEIPATWSGYQTELFLERVKWESRVWVDGKELSKPDDGLVVSHIHNLGVLSPGKHLISVRIDNRMIHPIGDKGHNYAEHTESIWNGIVGKIELRRLSLVNLSRIRLFPNAKAKEVIADLTIVNAQQLAKQIGISVEIRDNKQNLIGKLKVSKELKGEGLENYKVKIPVSALLPWSEFQQPLYTAVCTITVGDQTETANPITFGSRELKTDRYKIIVNNVPTFIRGNHEALSNPPTGYPPTDVASWKRIFEIYKSYGLNQVRFHSSCPPDAAFQAADEVGIYMMVELVWMTSINAKADLRPISATMGIPKGLGNGDRTIDSFVEKETRRLLDQFGNHPSFCFFAFGNEMDNLNKTIVNDWLEVLKKDDPRHLYAGTTARMVLPNDDFQESHIVPGKDGVVNKAGNSSTISSYDSAYVYTKVPVIAHELGQFPVYPVWTDINKYDQTPFRFINLEKSLVLAKENHIDGQAADFRKASGYLQQLLYKNDIERELRSRYSAGFNMLSMNDYTGQGEAIIGWLDAFYDSKGITDPATFTQFCNTVVPLAQFGKRVYKNTESLQVYLQLACNTPSVFKSGLNWRLIKKDSKAIITSGKFASKSIYPGTLADFGAVNSTFPNITEPTVYTLVVSAGENKYTNKWDFWVYPDVPIIDVKKPNIAILDNIADAIVEAKKGKKVLFLAHNAGNHSQKDLSGFMPVFWSATFFPGEGSKTLSALVNNNHPSLKEFPTGNCLDWQWQDLCDHSRGTILDGEALDIKPIVQPINDFHANKKLATLFEAKVGIGSILICGYNIADDLESRPAAKQLRQSLLNYVNSDYFNPEMKISENWLRNKFYTSKSEQQKIDENQDDKTIFALKPGAKSTVGTSSWNKSADELLNNKLNASWQLLNGEDVNDQITRNVGWKLDSSGSIKFELQTGTTTIGFLNLKLQSTTTTAVNINVFIDGRKSTFTVNNQAKWFSLQYFREDFDDKKLLIEIFQDPLVTPVLVSEIKVVSDN